MNSLPWADPVLVSSAREFLSATPWRDASWERLAGDASVRRYFRLRRGSDTAVLMDASLVPETVPPFVRMAGHLQQLGFSAPTILARAPQDRFLLLEDFGDDTFPRRLAAAEEAEPLYTLATDVLIALHEHPRAIPPDLRAYHPDRMLEDAELFLEWNTPGISAEGRAAFRAAWQAVLPRAHRVPVSFLHRDYHVANLMLLSDRVGLRRAGVLDFQDAYQGPVTYDLMSLLEDARRDVPATLREVMLDRYRAHFSGLDREAFDASFAILAALRHTRVLAIFERLSRREGKHEYKRLHSPRVERLLRRALLHPMLAGVKRWFDTYAW